MKLVRLTLFAAVLLTLLIVPHGGHTQVNIIGSLSNFDVVNETGVTVNDFKITIFGIRPSHIKHTFPNPKYGPPSIMEMPATPNTPRNTMVKYGPRGTAVTPPGGVEHFGVVLCGNPLGPRRVCYTWTRDGVPVNEGGDPNLPQQIWDVNRKRVIDVIRNDTWRQPRRLFVRRRINRRPGMVPLEALQRNSEIFETGVVIDPNPVPIGPDQDLVFDDPRFDVAVNAPQVETMIMMYDVFTENDNGGPGERIGTMLNAAWVQFAAPPITVLDWLSNFDVVNRTGRRVNDFKITLFGVRPNQILNTFINPKYGPGVIMGGPGPNDTMVIWGPPTNTNIFTDPGQTEHFGVRLRGNPIRPARICWTWTFNGEPVTEGGDPNMPTQIWDPVACRMVDIIRNVTWRAPTRRLVMRRVNRRDSPIRLEELLRNMPLFEQGQRIDSEPIPIEPDQDLPFNDSFFDVFAELPNAQGVAMMYDVFTPRGQFGGELDLVGTMFNAANVGLTPMRTVKGQIRIEDCDEEDYAMMARFRPINTDDDNASFFDVFFDLNADGSYSLPNIPAGVYSVRFKSHNTLAVAVQVNVLNGDATNVNASLKGGDADNNNIVDQLDLADLIQSFDREQGDPLFLMGTDFNCDGLTAVDDLDVLIRNFDMEGDA
jgi:hypothetical protein